MITRRTPISAGSANMKFGKKEAFGANPKMRSSQISADMFPQCSAPDDHYLFRATRSFATQSAGNSIPLGVVYPSMPLWIKR